MLPEQIAIYKAMSPAKKLLLAACVSGQTPVDWEEVNRLGVVFNGRRGPEFPDRPLRDA